MKLKKIQEETHNLTNMSKKKKLIHTSMSLTIAWALSLTFCTSAFTFSAACAFTVTSFKT